MDNKECTEVSGYDSINEAVKRIESKVEDFVKTLNGARESMERFFGLLEEMSDIIGKERETDEN